MKKICKSLLLTLLAVALMFNTFGIVLANTTTASIAVREEALEDGVSKLVFKVTTPAGADGVSMMNIVFSYDESKVQLIDSYDATTETTNIDYAFKAIAQGRVTLTIPTIPTQSKNGRTAVAVAVSTPGGASFDATAGTDVLEFYYKIKDGKEADSETFTLEKDIADGSFIAGFYPTASNRIPAYIDTITVSGSVSTPSEQYKYVGGASDTLAAPTFTYTGSDKLVLKELALDPNETSVNVPTVYPAQTVKDVAILATATSTINTGMQVPADAVWSLEAPAGVTLDAATGAASATLKVAPGAAAGTAKVTLTSGTVSKTIEIAINRATLKAAEIEVKADGNAIADNEVTLVKPATEDAGNKEIVFTSKVYDQYGGEMDDAIPAFIPYGNTSDLDFNATGNPKVTATYETTEGYLDIKAMYDTASKVIRVNVVGLDVNWSEVTVASEITYGATNASAVTLPADSKGTASVDGATVTGVYSVVDADVKQDANDAATVTVKFVSDDIEANGEYKNIPITNAYTVKINKAETVITANDILDAVYNGQEVKVVATTNRGTDDSDITYDVRPVGSSIPTPAIDAGEYNVYIYVPETANYLKNSKDVTIKIAKAPTVITVADGQTATYDGTAKAIVASVDNEVSRLEYSYLKEGAAAAVTEAVDAGTYTVTVSAPETTNYAAAENKVVTYIINKAVVTKYVVAEDDATEKEFDATITALEASTNGVTSVEGLAGYTLYGYLWAAYEGGVEDILDVTWTTEDTWNAKGGVYTYTAVIPENENLIVKPLEAEITVSKVEGEISAVPAIANKTVAKGRIEAIEDEGMLADLDIPTRITVSYPTAGEPGTADLDVVWNKTIADLKAAAATVTDENDAIVELVIDDSTFTPVDGADFSWLTIETGKSMTLTITNKTPATVTLTQAGTTYGTELPNPETGWTPSDDIGDVDATIEVTYVGVGDTVYEASTEKPVKAGRYEAVAKLKSNIYSGTSEKVVFDIAPKAITYVVDAKEKKYSDANPEFTGALAAESTLADADNALVTEENTVEKILGITFDCDVDENTAVGNDYNINAEASNANYDVTVTSAKLVVLPKPLSETEFVPVISGPTDRGAALSFAVAGLAADQYVWQWIDASLEATYTLDWSDSNRVITVTITGQNNYTGSVTSEGYAIPKYEIEGTIGYGNDNGGEDDAKLDVGDIITLDTSSIVPTDAFDELNATATVTWYAGEETVLEGEDEWDYTLVLGNAGVLKAIVTVGGDFTGEFEVVVGEIGKTPLAGTITLTESEGVVTADATAVSGVAGTDYDLVWYVDGVEVTATEGAYTVVPADFGKTLTVKAVAKGDVYTGEVIETYAIPAKAPSDVTVATTTTATSITATVTATENGAVISSYTITITDGADYTDSYTGAENVYTFEGLTTGTEYTTTATATNSAGTSEVSAPVTATATATSTYVPRPTGTATVTPSTPTTPDAGSEDKDTETEEPKTEEPKTEVEVKVEDTTATVDSKVLEGKEEVTVEVKTEEGASVGITTNIKDAAVAEITASANETEATAIGAAAEEAVGAPIEIGLEAKDAEGEAVELEAAVSIPAEEGTYAYVIDETGVAVRADAKYDAETGALVVEGVTDGTVVVLSKKAPETFADAAGHWGEGAINFAADAGLMNGVGGGAFDPDGKATRGMINAMLVRLAKATGAEIAEATDAHKVDTDAAHWAAATDLVALANGWTTGIRTLEDGTVVMDTDATVTREQLVTMLWRFVEHPEAEGELEAFDDHHETSDWAKDAKAWAVGAGIITGKPGNILDPNGTATRAEIGTMFQRLMAYMVK